MPIALMELAKHWKAIVFAGLIATIFILWKVRAHDASVIVDLRAEVVRKDSEIAADRITIDNFNTQVAAVQARAKAIVATQQANTTEIVTVFNNKLASALNQRRAVVVPKDCDQAITYANTQAQELGKW